MPRPEAENPGWTTDNEVIVGGGAQDVNRAMAEGTPTAPDLSVIDGGKDEKSDSISVKEGLGIPLSDFDDAARTAEFQAVRAQGAAAPAEAVELSQDIQAGAYDAQPTEAGEHSVALAQLDAIIATPLPENASRAELKKMLDEMTELSGQVQKDFGETGDVENQNAMFMKIGGSEQRVGQWMRKTGEIGRRLNEPTRPRGKKRVHEIPEKKGFVDRVKGFFSRGQ